MEIRVFFRVFKHENYTHRQLLMLMHNMKKTKKKYE